MLKIKKKIIIFILLLYFLGIYAPVIQAQGSTFDDNDDGNRIMLLYMEALKSVLDRMGTSNSSSPTTPNIQIQKSADFPIQLVNQIKNTCVYNGQQGVVNRSNISCLDSVNILTRDILKESAIDHENLQCVGFVRAIVTATTGLDVCETAGSAKECKNNNTYYEFVYANSGRQIQPGDLPIWSFLEYGHIAYVTKVNGSKYFDVAEANFTNGGKLFNGSVQIRHATTDEPEFAGWLTKKI